MKATLEFTLPEEAEEHRMALDGQKWQFVVTDLLEELRGERKHKADLSQSDYDYNEKISERIHSLIQHQGLEL